MTADIRTAVEAAPVFRFTNAQWREYQQIPDQGYSHRHWIEHQVNEWAARVTPTRDQIAEALRHGGVEIGYAGGHSLRLHAADAVLSLMAELAEGEK